MWPGQLRESAAHSSHGNRGGVPTALMPDLFCLFSALQQTRHPQDLSTCLYLFPSHHLLTAQIMNSKDSKTS